MIDVKEAIQRASDYLKLLYNSQVTDPRLEGVVWNDTKNLWMITLSFVIFPNREHKEFEVDSVNGGVKAMRIRQLA